MSEKTRSIDLEHRFHNPHHYLDIKDPGLIVSFKINIDGEYFEVKDREMQGREILELVGKSIDEFSIIQLGEKENDILPHELVDFLKPGIERFVTKKKSKEVHYRFFVDKKEYVTKERHLTVRQILVDFAKVDPNNKTLAKKKEGGFEEYKNLDEKLDMKGEPHFILFDNTPAPVS